MDEFIRLDARGREIEKLLIDRDGYAKYREATTFDAGVTRVYCWTKAKAATVPGSLKHVWSVDGKEVSEVPLTLSVSPARTWSYKTVWPGAWKVEIKDDAGAVLKSIDFTVANAAAAPAPASPQ
jgi:hypothetical protein